MFALRRLPGRVRRWFRGKTRRLVAHARFLARVFREFWITLGSFLFIVIGAGWLISRHYDAPGAQPLSLVEGTWAAFMLVFGQPAYQFPRIWYLQALFFLLPLSGFALLAEGLLSFLAVLLNHEERREDWNMALASTYSDHIVLCGLGKIGYRVLQQLQRTHEDVVAIEKNGDSPFLEDARTMGVPVVIADPTRESVLAAVNVARAKVIIAATDDDLANLEIALDARDLNPEIRVVLRMFNEQLMAKVKRAFNIQVVFSTAALAGPVFASASVSKAIKQSFFVDEDLFQVAELRISEGSALAGMTLEDVKKQFPLRVVTLRHDGQKKLFPANPEKLQAGDLFVVIATLETVKHLEEANGGA